MAGIIKAGSESGAATGAQRVAFNFNDMSIAADGYLENIRRRAAQILAEAKQDADRLRQQAVEEGRQRAVQQAEAEITAKIRQQLGGVLPALEQSVDQLQKARQEWVEQWQQKAVQLAARIAERVIRRELTSTPEITLDLVREALELASGSERVELRLNPADREALGAGVEEMAARLAKLGPTEVVADPSVSPGGCIVSTDFGDIDQRIESQLARIEKELS